MALFNYPSASFSCFFHDCSSFLFVSIAFWVKFDPKPYSFTHLNSIRASTLLRTLLRSIPPTLSPTYLARCGICRRHLDPHRAAGTPVRVWAVNLLPCLFAIYLALHLSCTSPFLHFIFLALHPFRTSPFLALHLSAFCFSWGSPFYFFHLTVLALHLSALHLSWASPLTSCT